MLPSTPAFANATQEEVGEDPEPAADLREHRERRDDRPEQLAELETRLEPRHVPRHQVDVLAEQQLQDVRRVVEQREADPVQWTAHLVSRRRHPLRRLPAQRLDRLARVVVTEREQVLELGEQRVDLVRRIPATQVYVRGREVDAAELDAR
jgi:hypothetical protein